MPDATGLELIAQRVRESVGDDAVTDTIFARGRATLGVAPTSVHDVIAYLRTLDDNPVPLPAVAAKPAEGQPAQNQQGGNAPAANKPAEGTKQ